jgi:hypothetical protein
MGHPTSLTVEETIHGLFEAGSKADDQLRLLLHSALVYLEELDRRTIGIIERTVAKDRRHA